MKTKRLKAGEFTYDEMEFLLKKVERGTIILEKERIELENIDTKFVGKQINGAYYNYKVESKDKSRIEQQNIEQKEKIFKAINAADDFGIEYYGDYDDGGVCTLITYTLSIEPEDVYIERIKLEGRQIITKEKIRLKKKMKEETRRVLIEKYKIKKGRKPRMVEEVFF
jgi:phosphoribosylformylglycinamidine (FGAM) synthase-like enzyme